MDIDVNSLVGKSEYDINDLIEIVKVLRSENGCPWDKVQTHKSIKKDFLEEVYEVLEAIDCDSPEMMREELGDVLLQVVFHGVIEQEREHFTFDDVTTELCQKLIVRHPHVFGNVQADTVDKVLTNWDSIKKETKGQETFTDTLKSVPKNFPSLMKAQKLGKRANRAGIDFKDTDEVLNAVSEKLDVIGNMNADDNNGAEEIGNLLMLCANLARLKGVDAEEALADCCKGFIHRFEELENGNDDLSADLAGELYSYKKRQ